MVHSNVEAMNQWDANITNKVREADVLVVMTGEEEKESSHCFLRHLPTCCY
jgi:hypothetical protein